MAKRLFESRAEAAIQIRHAPSAGGSKQLSYSTLFCIMAQMTRHTREKPSWKQRALEIEYWMPSWKQRALEIEYWIMTIFALGAFGAGIVAAINAL